MIISTSREIDADNACLFGRLYCCATQNFTQSAVNYHSQNTKSPSMLGWVDASEVLSLEPRLFEKKWNKTQIFFVKIDEHL